jgi:hypothetical protein
MFTESTVVAGASAQATSYPSASTHTSKNRRSKPVTASLVLSLLTVAAVPFTQTRRDHRMPPRFEAFPVVRAFEGEAAAPKIETGMARKYSDRIVDGVDRGFGVFSGGIERKGPNFAGSLIVIQWSCGAPCLRMAIVDAISGAIIDPPISINGIGQASFDLPLLQSKNSVSRNPELEFRRDSRLMIVRATLGRRTSSFYFVRETDSWRLIREVPFEP